MQDVNSSPISCLLNYHNLLLYDLKPLHFRIPPPYQSHTHIHTLSLSLIVTVYGCFSGDIVIKSSSSHIHLSQLRCIHYHWQSLTWGWSCDQIQSHILGMMGVGSIMSQFSCPWKRNTGRYFPFSLNITISRYELCIAIDIWGPEW